ncbi:MAG: AI-2E family transporter [Oscillospiraceae bacterium]|nr:AI-2E family transporter [Oscillospiraceae bacterium]
MFKKNKYFALGMTLLSVIVASVLFYVVLTNLGVVFSVISDWIEIISSVLFGLVFAYLMNPLMMFVERLVRKLFGHANITERGLRRLSRALGVIVALLAFLALIYGLIALVVPRLVRSLEDVFSTDQLDTYYSKISAWLARVTKDTPLEKWIQTHDPLQSVQQWITKEVDVFKTITVAFNEVYSVAKTIFNMVIGVVVAVYLLISKERFIAQSKKIVIAVFNEKRANRVLEICRLTNKSLGGFIVGKLIDSLIIGILSYIGMLILGLPIPEVASVFIGLSNIIPFFGPLIGIVIGGVLILLQSPIQALYFVIFEFLLQQVDGNIIGPRILGGRLGISDFWILVSITVFSGLFGFPGMILGVPVFTVIYTLIAQAVNGALAKKHHTLETEVYYDVVTVADVDRYGKEFQESTVFASGDSFETVYDPDDDFEYEFQQE